MAATMQPEAVATDITEPALNGHINPPQERRKWKYLDTLLSRPGAFTDPTEYDPATATSALSTFRILVIGAGGLGCEILKNLALSGFKHIDVIDMDTIDVSNLNRQFLFREKDVGRAKAEVAAEFVMKRCPGVTITPYVGKIQDKDEEYYMQFQIVICGLDSIEARRWINATLVGMVDDENPDTLKPLIDGGTEGFKGQSRVVLPRMTSCVECQLDMHAPRAAVPLCTLATIPRQPQHCIEWAHIIAWTRDRAAITLDTDDPEHITWLYQTALARAHSYGISGVTYSLTQGVVKNIIPAIASTNAIIAASCCNEAFKLATSSASSLGPPGSNNYMQYTGDAGVYTFTFEHEKKEDCPVCGSLPKDLVVSSEMSLRELVETFAERADMQLKKPNLSTGSKTLYFSAPASLEEQTRPNLKRKIGELLEDGEEVAVSDPAFAISFRYKVRFG